MADAWNSRFRQASAARRRAADPSRVAESDRHQARTLDPASYLESQGFEVKKDGQRHYSVRANGDEVYRLTKKPEGHWLWADHYGNEGGDNIALVAELEPGTNYAESVAKLLGGCSPTAQVLPSRTEPKRVPPTLPPQADQEAGRRYLEDVRGISPDTIRHAEQHGFLRYVKGAVMFVGRDDSGQAQNVIRRATDPADPIQKRDLKGSDKRYPPILPGESQTVAIVEGGPDALAAHDIAKRSSKDLPTVVVTGGANVLGLFKMDRIKDLLKKAHQVLLFGENEKDENAQARADAGHVKQAAAIQEITGEAPSMLRPRPEQGKDLAEFNQWQIQQQAQQAEKETKHDAPRI